MNPYEGTVEINSKGNFLSSKRNYDEEGIGIQIIRDAIEKGQGHMEITYFEKKFSIMAFINATSYLQQ